MHVCIDNTCARVDAAKLTSWRHRCGNVHVKCNEILEIEDTPVHDRHTQGCMPELGGWAK